jgi:hypothetical protein
MKLQMVSSKESEEPEVSLIVGRGDGHDHLGVMVNGRIIGYFHLIQLSLPEENKFINLEWYSRNQDCDGEITSKFPLNEKNSWNGIRHFELF